MLAFSVGKSPNPNKSEQPIHWGFSYGTFQDLTDKKERQAETPRSYRKFWLREAVYTNSPRAGLGVDRHTLSRISEENNVLS